MRNIISILLLIVAMIVIYLAIIKEYEYRVTVIELPVKQDQPIRSYDATTSGHIGIEELEE